MENTGRALICGVTCGCSLLVTFWRSIGKHMKKDSRSEGQGVWALSGNACKSFSSLTRKAQLWSPTRRSRKECTWTIVAQVEDMIVYRVTDRAGKTMIAKRGLPTPNRIQQV
jgi:hypothetical protein